MMFLLNHKKEKGHKELTELVSSLEKKIKEVGYISSKEGALLVLLKALKRRIREPESVYEKEVKIKKRLRVILVLMVTIGLFLIIDQEWLQILPLWSMNVYGYAIVIFIGLAMLSQDLRNLK